MGILVDLIIIGLIALCMFIGYKRGLIKASIRILSFFIAIVVALVLYRPVAGLIINNTNIAGNIQNRIVENILPEGANPDSEVQEVDISITRIIGNIASPTANTVASALTVRIIEIGTLLIIFIVVRFVLRFVTILTDIITKLPILKQFDELGGLIYGFIQGFLLVFTILAVILLLTPVLADTIPTAVSNSILGRFLYNNNLLLAIFFRNG